MVFKIAVEGSTHIFRLTNRSQFTVIPEESDFDLVEMDVEEAAERNCRLKST
jgi:hypothetical protein